MREPRGAMKPLAIWWFPVSEWLAHQVRTPSPREGRGTGSTHLTCNRENAAGAEVPVRMKSPQFTNEIHDLFSRAQAVRGEEP